MMPYQTEGSQWRTFCLDLGLS
ncbi:hypothetical protein MTBSS4_450025 [Magnetospirillum sp. SS-4]|nr:hypothetical protein MTBSS4_450025 [Magnetospirillum sp. SS-4]